jgi:CO/xanthine dehydrogenase FAD-binding subunit
LKKNSYIVAGGQELLPLLSHSFLISVSIIDIDELVLVLNISEILLDGHQTVTNQSIN